MKNTTLNIIYNRRSIRKFKEKPIQEEIIKLIIEAGVRAPTNCMLQPYSLIIIKDKEKKEKMAEICKQRIISQAPVSILICADLNRIKNIADNIIADNIYRRNKYEIDKIFSIFECGLVAENMILATESLGLGAVLIGTILNFLEEIAELFKLPPNVLPIILLCIGERNEEPPLRPRWPIEMIIHENEYNTIKIEDIKKSIKNIDYALKSEEYYPKYIGRTYSYEKHLIEILSYSEEIDRIDKEIKRFIKNRF
jgi:nitroreductase